MKLRSPDELGVAATIRTPREALYGNPKQTLTKDHDQILELRVAQIFICVLHDSLAVILWALGTQFIFFAKCPFIF